MFVWDLTEPAAFPRQEAESGSHIMSESIDRDVKRQAIAEQIKLFSNTSSISSRAMAATTVVTYARTGGKVSGGSHANVRFERDTHVG